MQLAELRVLSRFVRGTKSAITLRPQLQALGVKMEFEESWNKFTNIFLCVLGVSLVPLAYLIQFLVSKYSPLPEYPDISYFLMLSGFSISFLLFIYTAVTLSISWWLKYALKHHTTAEILQGIEAKFTTKASIYKWFQKVLKNT